jgi:hypothetical protein
MEEEEEEEEEEEDDDAISDNTLPSIIPESGRVNLVEINVHILNYCYKILN